ncbi:MAG: L-glutamine synthetase, partial [Pseudonocardiales bacterium]|nr:L-glutamine synthetase [Pseudonocardiales bacterium]
MTTLLIFRQHHQMSPHYSIDSLRHEIASGEIDTVIVAFTDLQGRLQGKRIHAPFFLDSVL